MGHGSSFHKDSHHHDEITARLEKIKKFDSKVQNAILRELDNKMKDLLSHHEEMSRRDAGKIVQEKIMAPPSEEEEPAPKRIKRRLMGISCRITSAANLQNGGGGTRTSWPGWGVRWTLRTSRPPPSGRTS